MSVLEHDVHPWIVPFERLPAYGIRLQKKEHGYQMGDFKIFINDDFTFFDDTQWIALEETFPSNQAMFRRENIDIVHEKFCQFTLKKQKFGDRKFSSASISSQQLFHFGRYEVIMKPAKVDGVITAFFLHRINPWQEIDVEILGSETTKLLTNVYFNPGENGTNYNYGNKGTPIIIDLTFDAAEDFHHYAIEWEPHELRWFVDNELIHVRSIWEPTPIPDLPMRLFCNIWPPNSPKLVGNLDDDDLPVSSYIKKIIVSTWESDQYING
jgi:beta-glucanase (GH16 family)